MVTIRIEEFEGYDIDEFNEYLLAQEDDEFELLLSKEGVLFFSSNNELAWEFAIAAFIGQKLSEIANRFSYSSAPLVGPGEFSFLIKTDKIEKLATILELISGGFGNSEISDPINLNSEVAAFIEKAKKNEIVCQDLLDTFYKYFTDERYDD